MPSSRKRESYLINFHWFYSQLFKHQYIFIIHTILNLNTSHVSCSIWLHFFYVNKKLKVAVYFRLLIVSHLCKLGWCWQKWQDKGRFPELHCLTSYYMNSNSTQHTFTTCIIERKAFILFCLQSQGIKS